MPTEEPSDEDARRPEEAPPEHRERPSEDDRADREEPARERRAVRVCDREWGFLALASPWAWTRGVGDG